MEKVDRMEEELLSLLKKKSELMHKGKFMEGLALDAKIADLKDKIYEAEIETPRLLSEILTPEVINENHLSEDMIECHLAGDFMADCFFNLRHKFEKLGLADCSLFPMLRELEEKSQKFADIICRPEFADLSEFMCTNDKFISDMHTISKLYMKDHLIIK